MELKDFSTIEDARLYEESVGKMISSDVMTMFLVQTGLYGYFMDHTDDICRAVADRIKTTSKFNFINDTSEGSANQSMVDILISTYTDKTSELTYLKSQLLSYANSVYYPFSEVTQLQLDSAITPSIFTEVSYPTSDTYIQKGYGVDVLIYQDICEEDVSYTLNLSTCSTDHSIPSNFVNGFPVANITIKAGEAEGVISLTNKKLRKYNKFFVRPDLNIAFSSISVSNQG